MKNQKTRLLAGLFMVMVLISALAGCGGSGYESTLDSYFDAHIDNDPELLHSITARYWIDYYEEAWGDDAMEVLEDSIEEKYDDWDCGEVIDISYQILSEKRANDEELDDLVDFLYDDYAEEVMEKDEFLVTDAYVVRVNYIVEGTEDIDTFDREFLVIKEFGSWKVTRGYIDCSFYEN